MKKPFSQGKHLIIIPDGLLGYLPFEILLNPEEADLVDTYKDLHDDLYSCRIKLMKCRAGCQAFIVDPSERRRVSARVGRAAKATRKPRLGVPSVFFEKSLPSEV